ncbi:hypothetical protein EPI10_002461 [Gossypium australe]|uniref:Uncharacterized protein n=1 Tax=Gossypium australe TaxID=47621 RepID=A0A5B6VEG6_9ROSI|nr:hypothetical protein EPI10_002461 [Gossypium australe]
MYWRFVVQSFNDNSKGCAYTYDYIFVSTSIVSWSCCQLINSLSLHVHTHIEVVLLKIVGSPQGFTSTWEVALLPWLLKNKVWGPSLLSNANYNESNYTYSNETCITQCALCT